VTITTAPACHGVLEACLYAEDLEATARFYSAVLGLEQFAQERDRHVFFRTGASTVFLLFNAERTVVPGGGLPVPPHGATGAGHVAFAIAAADVDRWLQRFVEHDVPIESQIDWPGGGRSIYVRDPAGNSVELATPQLWGFVERVFQR
jgi:catechol 2,3-dioxygenase-like lactoylglutathione lyase family enzyme